MNTYTANGKLLLTGEYLVLKGALALAMPVRLGQSMIVEMSHASSLQWNAYTPEKPWFSASLKADTLEILTTDDPAKAETIAKILKAVRALNPATFSQGLRFETHLDFNPEWGLGSSSTLIANLAQWAGVDPYRLLSMTLGGSGYDLACATAKNPIFYQLVDGLPQVSEAPFHPSFADKLYFIYQGKKQSSAKEVSRFNERTTPMDLPQEIADISTISRALPDCQDLPSFCALIDRHEAIMARCLGRDPLKSQYLDFEGSVKSLGAWGGDFFLAATEWEENDLKAYFKEKGLEVVFKYTDLRYD